MALILVVACVSCGKIDLSESDPDTESQEQIRRIGNLKGKIEVAQFMPLSGIYKGQANQGMAINKDEAFVFSNSGLCRVVDLVNKKVVCETKLASAVGNNHANTAQFSNTFLNSYDKYPLLYVSEYYGNHRCFVEHFDGEKFSLVQSICTSIAGHGNEWIVNSDLERIYMLDREDDYSLRIREFKLPEIDNNEVVLSETKVLRDTVFHWTFQYVLQGGECRKDQLLISFGNALNTRGIHIVDLSDYSLETIDLTAVLAVEPEDISFYNSQLLMSTFSDNGIYSVLIISD